MTIAALVAGYAGDDAWSKFAKANGAPTEAIEDVAQSVLGDQSICWMRTPIPALGGLSPKQVLSEEQQGECALRSLIMRLP